MKRNFTRVKLKTSDIGILAMSVNKLHETGLIDSRHYAFQREGDDSWSLTFDVLQEFHPLSKDSLTAIEIRRAGFGNYYECEDFEIVVIEYQNSKTPVIRKFDASCLENFMRRMKGCISDELELARNGDIEAGHRVFEHVASIDINEDDSEVRIQTLLFNMKRFNMIPQEHLVAPLRERFAHAMKTMVEHEGKRAMQSWFDAACLKARSMLNSASTAPRRAATI